MKIVVSGKKLVALRKKRFWSRARLAQACRMTPESDPLSISTLQTIEQSDVKNIEAETLLKLSKAFGMDPDALLEKIRAEGGESEDATVRVPAGHTALIVTDEAVESLKAYAVKYKLPSAAAVVERFAKNILKGTIKEAVVEQPSSRAKGAAKHLPARQQDQAQAQHDQ